MLEYTSLKRNYDLYASEYDEAADDEVIVPAGTYIASSFRHFYYALVA